MVPAPGPDAGTVFYNTRAKNTCTGTVTTHEQMIYGNNTHAPAPDASNPRGPDASTVAPCSRTT